jgi:hypothetical protein
MRVNKGQLFDDYETELFEDFFILIRLMKRTKPRYLNVYSEQNRKLIKDKAIKS